MSDRMGSDAKRGEIEIEVVEGREMTEMEIESVASILFTWWKREYERERNERMQSNQEKE